MKNWLVLFTGDDGVGFMEFHNWTVFGSVATSHTTDIQATTLPAPADIPITKINICSSMRSVGGDRGRPIPMISLCRGNKLMSYHEKICVDCLTVKK